VSRDRPAAAGAWEFIHQWQVGVPLLLIFAGLIGWVLMTPKAAGPRPPGLPPRGPSLIERAWRPTGLPLKVHSRGGFMGHGGFHLPTLAALSVAFAVIWSAASALHWLAVIRPDPELFRPGLAATPGGQAGLAAIRIAAFPAAVVMLYVLTGNFFAYNGPFLAAIWLAALLLRAVLRLAWRPSGEDEQTPSV